MRYFSEDGMDEKYFTEGMTIADLKELVRNLPEKDEKTGEDFEVWTMTGRNLSSPVIAVSKLNNGDILFDIGHLARKGREA